MADEPFCFEIHPFRLKAEPQRLEIHTFCLSEEPFRVEAEPQRLEFNIRPNFTVPIFNSFLLRIIPIIIKFEIHQINNHQNMSTPKIQTISASLLALMTWFCVILQFFISPDTFTNVISYFTILCNSLIAVSLTFSAFLPKTTLGKFFSGLSVKTAIALYIFIVFVVYNTVLRGIWQPTGWQLFLDNMLHVAIPILYILYWFFLVDKGRLSWKNGFYWLIFPFFYLIYSLVRGSMTNWYPYPFLNVDKLGFGQVMVNSLIMLIVFLLSGSALIAVNNRFEKK